MCRVEERVYIDSEGRRQKFEEIFPCGDAPRGGLCQRVKRKTTEYFPKNVPVSRDSTASPASNNPPTPTGSGSYYVEQRRPSNVSGRPSTRDGPRVIEPKLIIEFGGGRKDNKTKKYPAVSLSTKSYKRSSIGASSIGSNEVAVDSPGSDASFTIRTGFPDTPTEALHPTESYTRPAVPQSHNHRHTSSSSSFTSSSQPPSLYVASDQDSPTTRRVPRYPPTIVHNPPAGIPPPSPASSTQAQPPSSQYRTQIVTPHSSSRDNLASDGLFPLNYSGLGEQHSASSRASSGAPEITERAADRERRRKQNQEQADRRVAEEIAKEEEQKQVRFELGRYEARAQERAEKQFAEKEKRRAEDREDARRRGEKEREREAKAAKEAKKDRSKPPTRENTSKRPGHFRRPSMTQADIDERNRLLAETKVQMAREREATEAREREERASYLRQQQQTSEYWDPRGGERYPIPNNSSTLGRRGSISSGRRGSISSTTAAPQLGRSSSKRVSVIQPTPPPTNTSVQQQYSTRPPSSHRGPPPLSFPVSGAGQSYSTRPPSARRPSYSQENPFAQPATRNSVINSDNPFASPLSAQPQASRDPWDAREMREALPHTRQLPSDRNTLQRRGEDVISRATSSEERIRGHGIGNAQQATRAMGKAVGFEDDYESDSSSENDEDKLAGYGKRLGLGKRRN